MTPHESVVGLAARVEDVRTGERIPDVFELDPERLPALRAELTELLDSAMRALLDASQLTGVEPPAADEVSVRATDRIRAAIETDDRSLIRTCTEVYSWISEFLTEVESAMSESSPVDALR